MLEEGQQAKNEDSEKEDSQGIDIMTNDNEDDEKRLSLKMKEIKNFLMMKWPKRSHRFIEDWMCGWLLKLKKESTEV